MHGCGFDPHPPQSTVDIPPGNQNHWLTDLDVMTGEVFIETLLIFDCFTGGSNLCPAESERERVTK